MGCFNSRTAAPEFITLKSKVSINSIPISVSSLLRKTKGKLSKNYSFLKKIGSGAFSDVHLCLYKPLNQHRAVKIIHKSSLHQQQIDESFMLKEILILISIDHPNILKCYEIFEDELKYYISMDYCAGGELFHKIQSLKRFSESQVAEIFYQIFSGLYYCHEKQIIHRDLKPENILLEDEGEDFHIKLADFGSSCFSREENLLCGCFGSAYYVAPEVLRGDYNEKCDIWSVGILMYIMLTGRSPYLGSGERVILNQVKNHPFQVSKLDIPDVSEECFDLLKKSLNINPEARISARDALEHPWINAFRKSCECPDLLNTLKHLSSFNSSSKLKNAVYLFLASQTIAQEELQKLKQEFMKIDKNGDGKLSKAELVEQYSSVLGKEEAVKTVEKIMKDVDINKSGDIDYTEFLAACMKNSNVESKANLEAAFRLFDKDGKGFITSEEIKLVLGNNILSDRATWVNFIKEVDQNGDGVIDLREFLSLMQSMEL